MRLVVASDIHGNLRRLDSFVNKLDGIDGKHVYILGDLIHWGESSEQDRCVELVRARGFNVVKGNHEDWALNVKEIRRMTGLDFKISPENVKFLNELPEQIIFNGCMFSHSIPPKTPIGIRKRITNAWQSQEAFDYLLSKPEVRVGFVGHFHEPVCFYYDPRVGRYSREIREVFSLGDSRIYIINPGSIGLRDKASYVVFDTDKKTFERKELE